MKEIRILKRLAAIISRGLSPNGFENIEHLSQLLALEGFENVSERSLVRDLQTLRTEFGINFRYSNLLRRWVKVEADEVVDHAQFLNLLDLEGLSRSLRLAFEGFDLIELEAQAAIAPIQLWIGQILTSIKEQKVIKISYLPFGNTNAKQYELEPLKLKEFRSRWYLAGSDILDGKTIKTFGIERITELKVTKKTFDHQAQKQKIKTRFSNVLGVTWLPNQTPQTIVVKVSPKFANYLISIPLHSSQIVSKNKENGWTIIEWNLIVNQELISELLRFGDDVVVIQPLELVETIKSSLQNAINRYG